MSDKVIPDKPKRTNVTNIATKRPIGRPRSKVPTPGVAMRSIIDKAGKFDPDQYTEAELEELEASNDNEARELASKFRKKSEVYSKSNFVQSARQEYIFEQNVIFGRSLNSIAKELDVDFGTVKRDLERELALRQDEMDSSRLNEKVKQLMLVQRALNEARASRNLPGVGAFGAYAKLLEMRAKLLGLDAPTKIELGVQNLLDAIDVLPEESQSDQYARMLTGDSAATEAITLEVKQLAEVIDAEATILTDTLVEVASDLTQDLPPPSLETPELPNWNDTPVTDDEAISRAARTPATDEATAAGIERGRDAVRAAMQRLPHISATAAEFGYDPITGLPIAKPVEVDCIIGKLAKTPSESVAYAIEVERTRTEGLGPLTQTPPDLKVNRSKDPAARIMDEPWFAKLAPEQQRAVVDAARAPQKDEPA